MIDPHDPCPPAHLPSRQLVILGLLTPLLCGVLACSFLLLPTPLACVVTFSLILVTVVTCFLVTKGLASVSWDRLQEVRLRFLVVEAQHGQPIPGARVCFFRPTQAGPTEEVTTDPQGKASVAVACQVAAERGLLRASSSIYVDGWFTVAAEGYEGTGRLYLSCHRFWMREIGDTDPPPIRVELKRLPAAGKEGRGRGRGVRPAGL
jgi:hypothetical protein